MQDSRKTKQQLLEELVQLRRRMPRITGELASVLFDSITDSITVQDLDFNVIRVNNAVESAFGSTVIGKKCYAAYQGRSEPCPDCPTERVIKTGLPAHSPRQQGSNNSVYEIFAFPVHDEKGKLIAVLEHGRDITEQSKAQDALRASQSLYHDLVETSQDLVWQCDAEGRYTYLNPAWEQVFGYRIDEMLGHPFSDFQSPDWAERDKGAFSDVKAGATLKNFETVHVGKDGREIPLVFNAKVVCDSSGKVVGTRGTAYDVTERKRRGEELEAAEARYRSIFESSADAILVLGPDGKFIDVSRSACERLGYTREQLLSMGPEDITTPKYAALSPERTGTILREGRLVFETEHKCADGTVIQEEGSGQTIVYDGKPAALAVFRDVTDRKRMEAALKASEQKYATLVESSTDGIAILQDGLLKFANLQAASMLGYERQQTVDRPFIDFVAPHHRELMRERNAKRMRGEDVPSRYETEFVKRDGTITPVDLSMSRIVWEGRPAAMAIVRDITERKKSEEALRRSEFLLKEAERVSGMGSWSWAAETDTVTWSDQLFAINKRDPRLGATPFIEQASHYLPESWERLQAAVQRAMATGEPYELELNFIRGDGAHRWMQARGEVVRGSGGKIIGLQGTVLDITEHKKVDEEVLKFRKAAESSGDALFMTDRDGTLRFINPEFTKLYGYTADEVVGKTTPRVLKSGVLPDEAYQVFWRTLCSGQVVKGELINRKKNGKLVDVESSSNPIMDDRGQIVGFLAVQHDITERKKAENEARKRREVLEHLHRLSRALSSSLDLNRVLGLALEDVAATFGRPRTTAGIALFDELGQQVTVVAAKGADEKTAVGATFPLSIYSQDALDTLLKQRKPWVYSDISLAPEILKARPGFMEQNNLVLVPLVFGDSVIGYMFLGSADKVPYGADEVSLLETYAGEIALSIQNARLYGKTDAALQRKVADLQAIADVLGVATRNVPLDAMMEEVLHRSAEALGLKGAAVVLIEGRGEIGNFRHAYTDMGPSPFHAGSRLRIKDFSIFHQVLSHLKEFVVSDTATLPPGDEREMLLASGMRSVLVVPMTMGGEAIGLLAFASPERRNYSPEDISLALSFGSHVASIVENAELHDNIARERSTLEAIIGSMSEGLLVVDAQRTVVYCNEATERLLGFESSSYVGQPMDKLYELLSMRLLEPKDWRSKMEPGIKNGVMPVKFNAVVQMAQRQEVEGVPFMVERKGKVLGMGVLLRDVTREREVDRMKTEFISIASHELRTPMTAILGFAELLLLRCTHLSPQHRTWVETIHRESLRLSAIIEDLLNVSRIEAGRLSLQIVPVDAGKLAEAVFAQLQPMHANHALKLEVADGVPEANADPDKLQQVLYNLIDNAVKYSPAGGEVTIRICPGAANKVVIQVADRGLGIPAEELPLLFTRFHRVERPETMGVRGTGLGLYIAKSLVDLMKGEISVRSTVNEGSTFTVTLPAAPADETG